jgi:hypothetical protein
VIVGLHLMAVVDLREILAIFGDALTEKCLAPKLCFP